jgi:hypothetical protein
VSYNNSDLLNWILNIDTKFEKKDCILEASKGITAMRRAIRLFSPADRWKRGAARKALEPGAPPSTIATVFLKVAGGTKAEKKTDTGAATPSALSQLLQIAARTCSEFSAGGLRPQPLRRNG